MGSGCSSCKSETVFYPELDTEKTRTILTTDGTIRVYCRSKRNTKMDKIRRNTT